jgi:3-hydroxyisobutyrate dehydrogenase
MKVALIGLGQMGAPMARRLIDAGFDLSVHDVSESARAAFGERATSSPREAATDADIVMTMLPNGKIVHEVLLGDSGALSVAAPGAIVVDTSSSDAIGTRTLATELARRGFRLVDAPVSGGMGAVAEGKLTIMVGGDDEAAVERVRPLLDQLAARIIRVGPVGSGHAVKSINNVIAAAIIAITSEGFVTAERFGVDPNILLEVLNSSTGRSGVSETIFKTQMLPRHFKVGFALGLMSKDASTAEGLADALDVPAPVMAAVAAGWRDASAALGGGEDFSNYLRHVELTSGGKAITPGERAPAEQLS